MTVYTSFGSLQVVKFRKYSKFDFNISCRKLQHTTTEETKETLARFNFR